MRQTPNLGAYLSRLGGRFGNSWAAIQWLSCYLFEFLTETNLEKICRMEDVLKWDEDIYVYILKPE